MKRLRSLSMLLILLKTEADLVLFSANMPHILFDYIVRETSVSLPGIIDALA